MKYLLSLFLLFSIALSAIEFGIDQFEDDLLENAILENQLQEKEGVIYYQNNPFTGVRKELHDNGSLALAESYRNGLKDGFSFAWYEDGSKKHEFYNLQGNKHGMCYTWYKNGNMQMMASLVRGKFSGQFKAFDQDGHLHFEMFRVDDALQDTFEEQRDIIDGDGIESVNE